MRLLLVAPVLAVATLAVASMTGTALAYCRIANLIVMEDDTPGTLNMGFAVPEALQAGEKVNMAFTSDGDNGVKSIVAMYRVDGRRSDTSNQDGRHTAAPPMIFPGGFIDYWA